MRKLLGVLIGTAIGLVVVGGMARLNLYWFQWPDFNWASPQAWGDAIAAAPMHAQAMVAGSWAIATLFGGLIAVLAARWATAGWMVSVLIAFAGVVASQLVPQPLWMLGCAVLTPFLAGLIVAGAS